MKKITNYFTTIITILIILAPINSFALTSTQEETAKRQNEINQQRLERERSDIIKRQERKKTEKIRKSRDLKDVKDDDLILDDKGGCIKLNDISITGNTIFSNKELKKKILKKYQDKCLKKSNILSVKQDLENYYISRGYSNARVYFNKKTLKQSVLSLFILEGVVENIKLENNSKIDKKLKFKENSKLFMAFPFKKNKVFNMRDFEQGLDQINRLQSSNAKMRSDPGKAGGSSNIIINNQISYPTNITLSHDNSGQESSGKKKKKLTISQDNLFGLYDNLYINYNKDDDSSQSDKFTKSIYSSFSLPLGYWTLTGAYSESEYLTTIREQNTSYKVSGQTLSKTFQLDKVLKRGKSFKAKLGTELNLKDTASFTKDTINTSGTHKLSILTIFNDSTIYTKTGTIFIKPSYAQGLDIFDARSDLKDITVNESHAQYKIAKLYSYYNTNFNIPKTKIPLNYLFTFDSQFSQNTLYGTEKISIGGRYSIRGFDENSISGDNGYYIKNDLKINTSYLLPIKLLNSKLLTFGQKKNLSAKNFFSKTYLTVFYDYGYVRNKNIISEAGEGYMSGAGIKLNYLGKYIDWDLTFSKGLHSPKFIQNIYDQQKDGESVYYNISAKFGLF